MPLSNGYVHGAHGVRNVNMDTGPAKLSTEIEKADTSSNKCHASSNRCLTSSNKKLLETIS